VTPRTMPGHLEAARVAGFVLNNACVVVLTIFGSIYRGVGGE